MAVLTSRYRGSPIAPGSLVRSSTAIDFTLDGKLSSNASMSNGLYSLTKTIPSFSPLAFSAVTVFSAVSLAEPIKTMIRSAFGSPR